MDFLFAESAASSTRFPFTVFSFILNSFVNYRSVDYKPEIYLSSLESSLLEDNYTQSWLKALFYIFYAAGIQTWGIKLKKKKTPANYTSMITFYLGII